MASKYYKAFGVFVVLILLVVAWAVTKEGTESSSPNNVPASEREAKELFATNCGACHTLAKAGTDGVTGPNLDRLLGNAEADANEQRTLAAVENGINGRMPKGILTGDQAEEVSAFVGEVAGK
jgi:mono/diheme cytochrome c family protein